MHSFEVALLSFALAALVGCESTEPAPAKERKEAKPVTRRSGALERKDPIERLEPGSSLPSTNVDLDVTDASVPQVLNEISRQTGVSIALRGETDARLTLTLRAAPWRDVLSYVAHRARLRGHRERNLIVFEAPPRNTLQANEADAASWLILLARSSGKSVIMPGGMQARITEELHDIPFEDALRITAETYGYTVETVK